MIVNYSFTIEPLMFIKCFGHRPSSMITQLICHPFTTTTTTTTCSGHNINCVIIDEDLWPKPLINNNVLKIFFSDHKRKGDEMENPIAKTKRVDKPSLCSDLIVLGLPWKLTEEELRNYFEQNFGDLVLAQVHIKDHTL